MQRPHAIGRRWAARAGASGITLMASALTGIAACAGADPTASAPPPASMLRLLVRPAQPVADTDQDRAALAREASTAAGLPVRYAAAVGPDWHAMQLACATPAECDAAVARMRAATEVFARVDRDERRRAHGP